jgi:hypothetical protein
MDALLTTIVAGAVVALIGAIAAYYFGGLRESQKQEYKSRSEEQEREEELNRRRVEALARIQAQASVIVEDVSSWAENVGGLPESLPEVRLWGLQFWNPDGRLLSKKVRRLLLKYSQVAQQRDAIATKMESLRLYYREQRPSLPTTARNLIESFEADFNKRYNPLSSRLQDYPSFRQRFRLKEDLDAVGSALWLTALIASLGTAGDPINYRDIMKVKEKWAWLPEAAEYARDWDFGDYKVAFEEELRKLMS